MTAFPYHTSAELLLGSTPLSAQSSGPRTFRTAALALRFAFEEAAPVSLRGARLAVGERTFDLAAMRRFYRDRRYPMPRKSERTTPAPDLFEQALFA